MGISFIDQSNKLHRYFELDLRTISQYHVFYFLGSFPVLFSSLLIKLRDLLCFLGVSLPFLSTSPTSRVSVSSLTTFPRCLLINTGGLRVCKEKDYTSITKYNQNLVKVNVKYSITTSKRMCWTIWTSSGLVWVVWSCETLWELVSCKLLDLGCSPVEQTCKWTFESLWMATQLC